MSPNDPAIVDTPSSISEKPNPNFNTMTLLLSKDDRVFLNFDNGEDTTLKFRPKILTEMGKRYNIEFTETELKEFEKFPSSMGVPMSKMKDFLAIKDAKARAVLETGIPIDSLDNQLADWILFTRQINPNVQACIKGDSKTSYPIVKKVLDIMQEKNVKQFNLVTNLDAVKINLAEIQK
jgi:hypothetical protein